MTQCSEREASSDELPLVDVYLPMMKSAAIISAGELGVFEALAQGPRSLAELATSTGSDERGLGTLVDLLAALGYLVCDGELIANTPHTQRWFTTRGSIDYTPALQWSARAWGLMQTLTDCVRRGGPERSLWSVMDERPEWGPSFSRAMHAFARHLAPDLIAHVRVPRTARRMLDLGGSHGLHSIAFCQEYPALCSVIVDQSSALTETAATVARAGLADRISLQPGDLRAVDWGKDYDVVLLLSVAHNQTADDNARLLARVGSALRPGGQLVIHEYPGDAPLSAYAAAFRVTLLTETGTRTWTVPELSRWAVDAGLSPLTTLRLEPPEKGVLLSATKAT
jgi:SAM-dependent methyltransferase